MNYHNITKDDMRNGAGLRTVLWVSGCSHGCAGCQNPITWDQNGGLLFDGNAEEELFDLVSRDYMSGLTFSGGDPLFPGNVDAVTRIARKMKEKYKDKDIWLYTGFVWEEISSMEIMNYIDVLVDGRYEESLRNVQLMWRGSSNQRVIDVKKTRECGNITLLCTD